MSGPGPRDLVGYGASPPDPRWPGGARLAVQFVINYEEGAERSVLYGDPESEAFLSEMVGAQPVVGARHMAMESLYEYGSRAGFWRLHRLFTGLGVPVTVFGVASAMAQNPAAVEAMQAADWEIASHGLRWLDYQHVPAAIEAEHIARAVEIHARLTGERPLGWYQGRTSPNTARLVAEGETAPKMLSIGLHCRLVGRPARLASLRRFLEHVLAARGVWVARRIDIARHWLANHPPAASEESA